MSNLIKVGGGYINADNILYILNKKDKDGCEIRFSGDGDKGLNYSGSADDLYETIMDSQEKEPQGQPRYCINNSVECIFGVAKIKNIYFHNGWKYILEGYDKIFEEKELKLYAPLDEGRIIL